MEKYKFAQLIQPAVLLVLQNPGLQMEMVITPTSLGIARENSNEWILRIYTDMEDVARLTQMEAFYKKIAELNGNVR